MNFHLRSVNAVRWKVHAYIDKIKLLAVDLKRVECVILLRSRMRIKLINILSF